MKKFSSYRHKRFRRVSLDQLKRLQPKQIKLFKHKIVKENYTIILCLDNGTKSVVEDYVQSLKNIDQQQFYMPTSRLHITILGLIDIKTQLETIVKEIDKISSTISLNFDLYGIGSNRYSAFISAYPQFDLNHLHVH